VFGRTRTITEAQRARRCRAAQEWREAAERPHTREEIEAARRHLLDAHDTRDPQAALPLPTSH
jgi:hypothetical protein